MAEHAYSIKSTDNASIILSSIFIEGVQNPHVKNKLRAFQFKNLKDIFGHAIQEDQKQKIRPLDFAVSPKLDHILNCTTNAIQCKACFKCGSEDHFIKDCPLSQQDNMVQKGNYTDHIYDNKSDSMTDKVMEPLTRLFTGLLVQFKLLTLSGQSSHSGPPNSIGDGKNGQRQMGFQHSHRQHANGNYHKQDEPNRPSPWENF